MTINNTYQAKVDANVARLEGLLANSYRLLEKSEAKRKIHVARLAELEARPQQSISQRITAALGTDDWVIVSQGGQGLVDDEDLDGLEAQ